MQYFFDRETGIIISGGKSLPFASTQRCGLLIAGTELPAEEWFKYRIFDGVLTRLSDQDIETAEARRRYEEGKRRSEEQDLATEFWSIVDQNSNSLLGRALSILGQRILPR